MSPYKNIEDRRKCQCRSKARSRRRQKKIGPLLRTKIFLFLRYPSVRIIGQGSFIMSPFIITSDNEVIGQIEASVDFGITIFPLQIDFSLTGPIVDEGEE